MNGTCNGTILGSPPPRALGGTKRSNIIKSQFLSRFQRFLNQTLCVFSQMKDIKHVRRNFHSTAWVGLGSTVGLGGGQFFSEVQPELVSELFT